jgi:hypothetical protein
MPFSDWGITLILARILKWIPGCISFYKSFYPITADAYILGRPPTASIRVTNTQEKPVTIHAVRIHSGGKKFSYFFRLDPLGTHILPPFQVVDYCLALEGTPIGRRQHHQEMPALPPNITDHDRRRGADIFSAIRNGRKKESWVEIDFNQFRKRRFIVGKTKELFTALYSSLETHVHAERNKTR